MSSQLRIIIETERLLLREITLEDTVHMLRLHADEEVQKYTGESVIESMSEMRSAIQTRISDYKKYGYGRWAVVLKDGMHFVGWAGLAYLPEFDEIDLGYRFLPQFWGNGLATEASQAILTFGFEKLKLTRIIAMAMKDNVASIRVMEKVGMKYEKLAPFEPGSEDVVWYSCDRNQSMGTSMNSTNL
ncbi:MAG: GNAT family N-acetyltransferase [Cyclobacteriaceae bacterium]